MGLPVSMGRLVLVLTLLPALVACGEAPLPPRLAELPRGRVLAGDQARRHLAQLHGRDVAPADSLVAEYGRGQLKIYLSRYRDAVTARRELERMLAGLRRGHSPFTTPLPDPTRRGRWTTVGLAAHHVLWSSGRAVYWLEGDPKVVFRAADQLPQPTVGLLL